MRVIWAPNPLRSIVELDDADTLLLRERLKVQELQERITSAYFALDPEHQAWLATIRSKERTPEKSLTEALTWLDLDYLLDGAERHGKTLDQALDERLASYVQELASEHSGDCTCVPCSCLKCQAESLLGIDTIAGLGNHEACNIGVVFKANEGETSIEDALQRLASYRPVWSPDNRYSEEEFQKHVPRWTEEGRRAHAWLDAYRREHFAKEG